MSSYANGNGNGNGSGNGVGRHGLGKRLLLPLLRRPSVALMRKYADWVEHSSAIEVSGPGASYAGSAIYVCSVHDVPIVFLHRAHYDDRALIDDHTTATALATFAYAAGLVVSRGSQTPPDLERGVRAGNGAIFIVGDDEAGRRQAELAATLAIRTGAPVIALRAEGNRVVRVDWAGSTMAWPGPNGAIRIDYGTLARFEGAPDAAAETIRGMVL